MLRASLFKRCAAAPSSCGGCVCAEQAKKYQKELAAAAVVVVGGAFFLSRRNKNFQAQVEQTRSDRIKALEDDHAKQQTTIKKLQHDVKVAQAALLSQETIVAKLAEGLSNTERSLATKAEAFASAIKDASAKTLEVERLAEKELTQQRRRLAELSASKAETEARFEQFEKKVNKCHELPTVVAAVAATAVQTTPEEVVVVSEDSSVQEPSVADVKPPSN